MRVEGEDGEIPFKEDDNSLKGFQQTAKCSTVFQKDHSIGCVESKAEMRLAIAELVFPKQMTLSPDHAIMFLIQFTTIFKLLCPFPRILHTGFMLFCAQSLSRA